MKAFLLKYRSSLLLFAVMFLFGWGSAAVVAKWQSDRETEETMHIEAAVDNWGLGFGESGKELQPTGNATADELKQYDTYYIGSKEEKVIYLTFDCGYENGNTEAILDALKKHNAPGTFFVVGHFLESAPELVKRMVTEGHTVGNHTYHHPDMSAISDKESFQKERDAVSSLFQEVTGHEMTSITDHRRANTVQRILRWQKNWGIRPFSGASPMWTGMRMHSRQRRRLMEN